MAGDLYVVATPIGNLGDMVPRAVEVLQSVDLIAAEDTRHSARLLDHFGIGTPLTPYHDHGESEQADRLIQQLLAGKAIALISDAGTPLVSDPGFRLIQSAAKQGVRVIPVPGACAAIAALSAAGLSTDRFAFEGFLPARQGQRKSRLASLAEDPRTLVFYEAPHRVKAALLDMAEVFGDNRELVMAREITKTFETFLRGTIQELLSLVESDSNQERGEIVLVVAGSRKKEGVETADEVEQRRVLTILLEEMPPKKAASAAAKITGGSKKVLYEMSVALKN
ncbi:MAG: 16S rRNA (cytidine(1402)-2'-O)-methyltransferase [bacterium]